MQVAKNMRSMAIVMLLLCSCQVDRQFNSQGEASFDWVNNKTIASEVAGKDTENSANKERIISEKCLPISQEKTANTFDPSQFKVGDSFLGLVVTQIEVSCANFGNGGEYVGTVAFKGEIVVSGTFDPKHTLPGDVELPCFFIVETNTTKVPRIWGDRRIPWFCFDNPEKAKQFLSRDRPVLAKITIDNYTINYDRSDVINRATITRVIETISIDP